MSLVKDIVNACLLLSAIASSGLPLLVRSLLGSHVDAKTVGTRLRRFLEQRGLTYRKLGQYLALRQDLLPVEVCAELDFLFEAIDPMPFAQVREIIEEELRAPLTSLFRSFEHSPVGSASVAQVHQAVALDGEKLAIKIQRRGIREEFLSEVRNFRRMARVLDFFGVAGSLSITQMFEEFADFTMQELDFQMEGRTADRLRERMGPRGHVPRIRWDLSTLRVLSMEYIEGISLLTVCQLSESGREDELKRLLPGVDLTDTISALAQEFFHQVFETGFFHGDPHPANLIVRCDGSFVFIDCGIFGELSPPERRLLSVQTETAAEGKYLESAHYYAQLCNPTPATNRLAWERELAKVLAAWYSVLIDLDAPLEERHMAVWQAEIANVLRKHHVRAGSNQLLVWRALMILDSTALRLPNSFDVHAAMVRFFSSRHPDPLLEFADMFTLRAAGDNLEWLRSVPGRDLRMLMNANSPTAKIQIRRQNSSDSDRLSSLRASRVASAAVGVALALIASRLSPASGGVIVASSLAIVFLLRSTFGGR